MKVYEDKMFRFEFTNADNRWLLVEIVSFFIAT